MGIRTVIDRFFITAGCILALTGVLLSDVYSVALGSLVALNCWGSNWKYAKLNYSVIEELGWKAQAFTIACYTLAIVTILCALSGYSLFREDLIPWWHRILAACIAAISIFDARRIPAALGGVGVRRSVW